MGGGSGYSKTSDAACENLIENAAHLNCGFDCCDALEATCSFFVEKTFPQAVTIRQATGSSETEIRTFDPSAARDL